MVLVILQPWPRLGLGHPEPQGLGDVQDPGKHRRDAVSEAAPRATTPQAPTALREVFLVQAATGASGLRGTELSWALLAFPGGSSLLTLFPTHLSPRAPSCRVAQPKAGHQLPKPTGNPEKAWFQKEKQKGKMDGKQQQGQLLNPLLLITEKNCVQNK